MASYELAAIRAAQQAMSTAQIESTPESVPVANADALDRGLDELRAAAGPGLEDAVRRVSGTAVRVYTEQLLKGLAHATYMSIRGEVLRGEIPLERVVLPATKAQDAASVAVRAYSAASAFLRTDNSSFDAITEAAKAYRKVILQLWGNATGRGRDEIAFDLATQGKIAAAVLGTDTANDLRQRVFDGDYTVTYTGENRPLTVRLNKTAADSIFSPPLLVGSAYPDVERQPNGTWRAVMRSNVHAALTSITGTSLLRANPDDYTAQLVAEGKFEIESAQYVQRNAGVDVVALRVGGGSASFGPQNARFMPIVPLANTPVFHIKRSQVSVPLMERYVDMD